MGRRHSEEKANPVGLIGVSEQDKDQVNKATVVAVIVEDLQSVTYSKYDLLKIIEYALLSYVEAAPGNHSCEEVTPNNCSFELLKDCLLYTSDAADE